MRDRTLNKLEKDIEQYAESTEVTEITSDNFTAVVQAPVQLVNNMYLDLDGIPDPKNLPRLPERMRDFAFNYATTYKPKKIWAKHYGVSLSCVERWVSDSRVQYYIALTRYERRMYLMGATLQVERKMYSALNRVLEAKINGYTVQGIVDAIKFAYKMVNAPESIKGGDAKEFNMSIGFNQGNPLAAERDVTPPYSVDKRSPTITPEKLKVLEEQAEYAKKMHDDLVKEEAKRQGGSDEQNV